MKKYLPFVLVAFFFGAPFAHAAMTIAPTSGTNGIFTVTEQSGSFMDDLQITDPSSGNHNGIPGYCTGSGTNTGTCNISGIGILGTYTMTDEDTGDTGVYTLNAPPPPPPGIASSTLVNIPNGADLLAAVGRGSTPLGSQLFPIAFLVIGFIIGAGIIMYVIGAIQASVGKVTGNRRRRR